MIGICGTGIPFTRWQHVHCFGPLGCNHQVALSVCVSLSLSVSMCVCTLWGKGARCMGEE